MSSHIVFGSPHSGKTTNLIKDYTNNKSLNKIIISFDRITRNYGEKYVSVSSIESHSGLIAPNCYKVYELNNLLEDNNYHIFSKDVLDYYITMFQDAEYIYIDDAHMYSDLKDFIIHMNSYGKHVYVYGLDSDKDKKKIGQMWDIIPYVVSIKKIISFE